MPGNFKYCFVPKCLNTTVITPKKMFFPVPQEKSVRKKWCELVWKDVKRNPVSNTSSLYCCEDHFDIENDVEHILVQKLSNGNAAFKLKPGVNPSKFDCQIDSTGTRKRKNCTISKRLRSKIGKIAASVRWHSNNDEKPSTSSASMSSEGTVCADVEEDYEPISDNFTVIEDDESNMVSDAESEAEVIVIHDSSEEKEDPLICSNSDNSNVRTIILPINSSRAPITKVPDMKNNRRTNNCKIELNVLQKRRTPMRKIPNILKSKQRLAKSSQNNEQLKNTLNNVMIQINPETSKRSGIIRKTKHSIRQLENTIENAQITFDSKQILPNMLYSFSPPNILNVVQPTSNETFIKCAVDSCDNYIDDSNAQYLGRSYFVFPEDPVEKQRWLTAINKPSDWNTSQSRICFRHFHKNDVINRKLLKNAVPTICNSYHSEENTLQRFKNQHQKQPNDALFLNKTDRSQLLTTNKINKNASPNKLYSSVPKNGLNNHLVTSEEREIFFEDIDSLNDLPIITIKEEPDNMNDVTFNFLDASRLKEKPKNDEKISETITNNVERKTSRQKLNSSAEKDSDTNIPDNKRVKLDTHVIIKEESEDYFEIMEDDDKDVNHLISDENIKKEEPVNDVSTDSICSEPSTSKSTVVKDIKSLHSEIIDTFMTYLNSEVKKNLEKLPPDKRMPLVVSIVERMNEFMKTEI